MRIDRLDLLAFGNFTRTALDFSAREKSLQVILGPNAAGKSTALRAVGDLLFGIAERTSDDFLHPKSHLRIGAVVAASDGRSLTFTRRKGRKDTLLDADGEPIPEMVLRSFIGPVDRDLFESMFGLGHERLRRGAEDLLHAGGALGESLFEAAAGTKSVRRVLGELSAGADRLFKPRASTPLLNQALSRCSEARLRARASILGGDRFRAIEEEIASLEVRIADRACELSGLEASRRKLERIQRNLPRVAARAEILAEMEALAGTPELPPTAREERLDLATRRRELEKAIDSRQEEMNRLAADLAELQVAEELLREAPRVQELRDARAVVRKHADDLRKRRAELVGAHEEVQRILQQIRPGLTVAEAESLRLPRPQVKRIQQLAKRYTELGAARESAEKSLAQARLQMEVARQRLAEAVPPPDVRPLAEALRLARSEGDLEAQEAESAERLAGLGQRIDAVTAALPGWAGTPDQLERTAVPLLETTRRFAALFKESEQELARGRERVDEHRHELERLREEIGSLTAAGDVPTEEQLRAARERRDLGWRLIRRQYIDTREDLGAAAARYDPNRPLPEAYEASSAGVDALADRMRLDAERVAQYQAARQRVATVEERLAEQVAALSRAREERQDRETEWRSLWAPSGVEPLGAEEMKTWLETRHRIVETLGDLREERGRHERIRARVRRSVDMLVGGLQGVGRPVPDPVPGLSLLLAHAERVAEEVSDQVKRRNALEQSVAERDERVLAAEAQRLDAERGWEEWAAEWHQAVASLGSCGEAMPTEVEELLNIEQFAREVMQVRERVAPELRGMATEPAFDEIANRCEKAVLDAARREEKADRMAFLQTALDDARRELTDVRRQFDAIVARAGCVALDEVERVEERAARKRELTGALREIEAQLMEDGGGLTLAQVLAETGERDGDSVAEALADVSSRSQVLGEERDREIGRRGELHKDRQELRRVTDAAALARQEAEEEMATIRSHAEEYARLRLAESVLRDFLERYRALHQSPIMQRASELFARLTLGSFCRLQADRDDADQPVVVGVTADGTPLAVRAMSDGTRDQLYLALRLAAVERYAAAAEPLPFIADDLLVHFDDDRARAALRTLAEFSRSTQVLFFTHHRHLVGLAREVVPAEILEVQNIP